MTNPLIEIWNPLVTILPFACSSSRTRRWRSANVALLPLALFLHAFLVQTHGSCAPPATLSFAGAVAWAAWQRRASKHQAAPGTAALLAGLRRRLGHRVGRDAHHGRARRERRVPHAGGAPRPPLHVLLSDALVLARRLPRLVHGGALRARRTPPRSRSARRVVRFRSAPCSRVNARVLRALRRGTRFHALSRAHAGTPRSHRYGAADPRASGVRASEEGDTTASGADASRTERSPRAIRPSSSASLRSSRRKDSWRAFA